MPTQDRVLVPEHQQLSILRQVAAEHQDGQAVLVFIGLAAAFGVPLVNGVTHLADRMPGYVASAQHGRGWIVLLAADLGSIYPLRQLGRACCSSC